jgi:uncharacterized membrane protein
MQQLVIRKVPASRATAWLKEGWALFVQAWGAWVVVFLILGLLFAVGSIVPIVGPLAIAFLTPFMFAGLYQAAREQEQTARKPEVGDLFRVFSSPHKAIFMLWGGIGVGVTVVSLLVSLVAGLLNAHLQQHGAGVGSSVVLLLLLVFFLFIFLVTLAWAVAQWWGFPASALADMPFRDAAVFSLRLTMANIVPLLAYGVLACVVLLAGAVALVVGLLVALPVVTLATYRAFCEMTGLDQPAATSSSGGEVSLAKP